MAPSPTNLHLFPSRRATYHKTRKGANKSLNWPYPLAASKAAQASTIHPDKLARAGWYSTPTAELPSRTTCFLCDTVVDQWEEGDDPVEMHLVISESVGRECGWAVLRVLEWNDGVKDKKEWSTAWGPDERDHPRGARVEQARQMSYERGWPHEGVKGVPSAQEIASAGWCFRPDVEEEAGDRCVCPYCTRTVEGWEAGDDPVSLHKRKLGLKCPFFLAPDPQEQEVEKEGQDEPVTAPVKGKMSRSKARAKLTIDDIEDEPAPADEDESVIIEPSQPSRPRSRRTKASTITLSSDAESEMVQPALKMPARGTRSRKATIVDEAPVASRSKAADEAFDVSVEIEVDVAQQSKSKAKGKSKATRGKKATARDTEDDSPTEAPDAGSAPSTSKKSSALSSKSPPVVAEDDVVAEQENDDAPEPVKKKGRQTKAQKAAAARAQAEAEAETSRVEEEHIEDVEEPDAAAIRKDAAASQQDADVDAMDQDLVDPAVLEAIVVEEPARAVVEEPAAVPKPSSSCASKPSKNKSSKSAPGTPVIFEDATPVVRAPLTPTVASASPRPIRSLPRTGSKSTPPIPATSSSYTPRTNPFIDRALSTITDAERAMSVRDWVAHCGASAEQELRSEMEKDIEVLKARFAGERAVLVRMLESALERERRERVARGGKA